MLHKYSILIFSLLIVLTGLPEYAWAQNDHEVSGRIVDSMDGEPLVGVNIIVSGTEIGTASDVEGSFELTAPNPTDTLVFRYVGYRDLEIPIDGRSEINVELEQQVLYGEEAVVVGYGVQRRRDITGAVSSVDIESIGDKNVQNLGSAIQGMVPGVNVRSTGQPGSEPSVEI